MLFKKLLPPGLALKNIFDGLADLVDQSLNTQKKFTKEITESIVNNTTLSCWRDVFEIDSNESESIKKAIKSRFKALGGQSKKYLTSVLESLKSESENPTLIIDHSNQLMKISGISLEVSNFKVGSAINKALKTSKRNETLIKNFEAIKHAHTEARYYK